MRLSFAVCALLLLSSLGSCKNNARTTYATGLPTVKPSAEETEVEQQMFQRLNRDRQQRGLAPLTFDARLADIARYHSADMRDHEFFGHDSPTTGSAQDRIEKSGYMALESRENVAQAPDMDMAQDQLLASPGHFANIVATTVTHLGIGVVRDKEIAGQVRGYYFTQLFAKPAVVMSPFEAKSYLQDRIIRFRKEKGIAQVQFLPRLDALAQAHVARVDVKEPGRTLGAISESVIVSLSKERGLGLSSVEASAGAAVSVELFQLEQMLDSSVRAVGIAVAQDKDERGKPMLKMLLLAGR